MPAPSLLLAAIAARTSTLRLGTAIVQLPLAHPLRIAEEIATLDVLSGGRVEFGVGRGGNPTHFGGFGVPLAESRQRMVEGLELIRRAWTEERFSFSGRFFQVEDLQLAPRPLQQPHPPIRVAVNSPDTAEWAGREGFPIFVASNINPFPKLRELLPVYRSARIAAGHAAAGADDVTLLMPLFVGERRGQIEELVTPSVNQFAENMAAAAAPWLAKALPSERPRLEAMIDGIRRMSYASVNTVSGIFDTPAACVERLQQIQAEFNPGRVICWFNFGGMIPHEQVMRSMQLFARSVMPHV
jgi:alkanesulfonate monooxygenase SsuD/methylene tetrahydromethanopterin reductase-like flavin-dependent oxidoreductase (luciferase family)